MDLLEKIDRYLEKREDKDRDKTKFHISELGRGRKFLYDKFMSEENRIEKPAPQLQRIFDNGHHVHSRYYHYFTEMGLIRAVEVQAIDNEVFTGTADAIIAEKDGVPWVIDIKSCNTWVFKKLEWMKPEHEIQILFYMYYLNIPRGMVLYEDKNDQKNKLFKIYLDEDNKSKVERLIEEFKQLKDDIDNNREFIEKETKDIKVEDLNAI